jgi:hypothetical protein
MAELMNTQQANLSTFMYLMSQRYGRVIDPATHAFKQPALSIHAVEQASSSEALKPKLPAALHR